jgi:hypothetical protein
MVETDWSAEALRIVRRLVPGCAVEVLDARPLGAGEAWVCVRADAGECVLGLRRRPTSATVDLLYLHARDLDVPDPSAVA